MAWLPDSPLVDSVVPARYFTTGPHEKGKIRLLVLHSTESPEVFSGAENVARWWAGSTSSKSSCCYVVDADSVVQCVKESDIAWHAPGANHDGIGIEHVGYAKQDFNGWQDEFSQSELRRSAQLAADICKRYDLPAVYLDAAGLKRGERGITTHNECSKAWRPGGHWDPGPGFPITQYIGMVKNYLGTGVTPTPPPLLEGISENLPILGPPICTLAQANAVVNRNRAQNANGYNLVAINEILAAYWGTCELGGLSFAVAVAQAIHETGWFGSWWSARPRRNPAGIGVSGVGFTTEEQAKKTRLPYAFRAGVAKPWVLGNSFHAWAGLAGSVDCHVGRLLAYAIPKDGGNANQKRLIDIALKARPLPDSYRGRAPTLQGLEGSWATPGDKYADALVVHIVRLTKG